MVYRDGHHRFVANYNFSCFITVSTFHNENIVVKFLFFFKTWRRANNSSNDYQSYFFGSKRSLSKFSPKPLSTAF